MPIGTASGNWTYPLLQQINRQGDIMMYGDQARRANQAQQMNSLMHMLQIAEMQKKAANENALTGALQGFDFESTDPAGLAKLSKVVSLKNPQAGMALYQKAVELESARRKAQEMTPYQEEMVGLRKQIAADSQSARDAAAAERARQDAALNEHRSEMRRLEQERLNETKSKNLRDEQGTKPPKGYRWNENQELEPIPGSQQDIKIRGEYATDAANLSQVTSGLDRMINSADELIGHKGLPAITGYRSYIPDIVNPSAMDADKLLKSFKSKVFVGTIQDMRSAAKTGSTGMGQLTEREGEKLENSLESLDRAQTFEQMQQALRRIKSYAEAAKARINRQYQTEWEGRSPKPMGQKQTWTKENLEIHTADDFIKNKFGAD